MNSEEPYNRYMGINLNIQALDPGRCRQVERILQAGLDAADPYRAVITRLRLQNGILEIEEMKYPLNSGRIFVCGFGKAVIPMAQAVENALNGEIAGGAVIAKHLPAGLALRRITAFHGSHPLPAADSLESTTRLLAALQDLSSSDLVICLISGGGSALLTAPPPGISLEDLQAVNRLLLASGASIQELNTIRKHIDTMKGGGLWKRLQPARSACLILSDVIGDDLDIIASGPMTPDRSTFMDAWEIVEQYHLENRLPGSVRSHLLSGCSGSAPETLKEADYKPECSQVAVIGSCRLAAQAAAGQADREGFEAAVITSAVTGEASLAGRMLARHAAGAALPGASGRQPACLVFGGETTVTLKGSGLGGRNLETALASVPGMAGLANTALVTFATDGEDGPTPAAGAVVTGETLARAISCGLDVQDALDRNDSFHFFEKLGDLILCGPTGTNVNDLSLIFRFSP